MSEGLWAEYAADPQGLWSYRLPASTRTSRGDMGLYVIDREKMRDLIEFLVYRNPAYLDLTQFNLIADQVSPSSNGTKECSRSFTGAGPLPSCVRAESVWLEHFVVMFPDIKTYLSKLPIGFRIAPSARTGHSSGDTQERLKALMQDPHAALPDFLTGACFTAHGDNVSILQNLAMGVVAFVLVMSSCRGLNALYGKGAAASETLPK